MTTDIRGIKRLQVLLNSKQFLAEIEQIRAMDEFQRITEVPKLLQKYGLLSKYGDVVGEYVESGGALNMKLVRESVSITKTDTGRLSLVLAHDITQADLIKFINTYWRSEIEPALPGYEHRKRQEVPSIGRDERIYEMYLRKKELGLTNQGVALRNNVSLSQVTRVVRQYKKRH